MLHLRCTPPDVTGIFHVPVYLGRWVAHHDTLGVNIQAAHYQCSSAYAPKQKALDMVIEINVSLDPGTSHKGGAVPNGLSAFMAKQ